METGLRDKFRAVYPGAISVEITPGSGAAYELGDVVLHFAGGVLPTTAEDCEIYSVNSDGDEVLQDVFDPSTFTAPSVLRRFDKGFDKGDKIKVVWANSDPKSTTLIVRYRMQDSIT